MADLTWLRRAWGQPVPALMQMCRITAAAALALAAADILHLALPLWSVLTALFVTQISRGKSLRGTLNYLTGTIGGAGFGVVVSLWVAHDSDMMMVVVLAIAVAPLALLAALLPRFAIAPATAAIVILLPAMTHATPGASAIDRVMEVALGGLIGLVVSFCPPRPARKLQAERLIPFIRSKIGARDDRADWSLAQTGNTDELDCTGRVLAPIEPGG